MKAQSEIQILSLAGIVSQVQQCRHPQIFNLPQYNVIEKNKLAVTVTVTWVAGATLLLLWSVYAVVRVPAKRLQGYAHLDLANEDKAWATGLLTWISLGWVDGIIGRYGKCWAAVIEENEIQWKNGKVRHGEFEPYENMRKHWRHEIDTKGLANASIAMALFRAAGWKAAISLVVACSLDTFFGMVISVIVLERLVAQLTAMTEHAQAHPEEPQSLLEPTLCTIALTFVMPMIYRSASIFVTLLDGYYTSILAGGLGSMVFEKAMELPVGSAPQKENPDGENGQPNMHPNVIQILNVDIIECWQGLLRSLVMLILSPILIIVMFAMLVSRIHLAGVVGFLYCIPVLGVTTAIGRMSVGLWMEAQGWQDSRLRFLTETLINIRALKCLALEGLVFEKLHTARLAELRFGQLLTLSSGMLLALAGTIPWGCILLALVCLRREQGGVEAAQIVVVYRLMGSLLGAVHILNASIHKFIAVPNSFRRVTRYLSQADRPVGLVQQPVLGEEAPIVHLRGSFSFIEGKPPALQDIDVAIRSGECVAVIGAVASGKSAFLQAAIGELYPVGDAVVVAPAAASGGIAYCAQVPWIFEGTLRDNVVLRAAFDHDRYFQSLFAAALTPDLEILPGGDMVTIGSYGIRLSGGQRARVGLARAAYMVSASVVLMDDPFASVDVQTGQHICNELLWGPCMKDRTRIVVTQPNAARLRKFDKVVLLEDGKVVAIGTPEDVMSLPAFDRLQDATSQEAVQVHSKPTADTWTYGAETLARVCKQKAGEASHSVLREVEGQDHITWATIRWWLHAAGYHNMLLFIVFIVASRLLDLLQSVIMATWMNEKVVGAAGGHERGDTWFMVQIIIRQVAAAAVGVLMMWSASRVTRSASTIIHKELLGAMLAAPIDRFFDKQPIGRLINRMSFDLRQAEDAVPWVFSNVLSFIASFVIVETYILKVLPWRITIVGVPFFGVATYFAYLYRGTAVPLIFHSKFGMSKLHDIQSVVISSNGSIRANGMLGDFMCRYNELASVCIRAHYLTAYVCVAWVQSRMFLCMSVVSTIFTLSGLWSGMPLGTICVIITLSNGQMSQFEGLSGLLTGALNILNALQRLTRYFEISQEAPKVMPGDPRVRLTATLERGQLAALEFRPAGGDPTTPAGAVHLYLRGDDEPLLCASADGRALVLQRGRRLLELAPHCEAFSGIEEGYHIVAVNGASKDASLMAEELWNPPATLWLDLWHSRYFAGMRIQIEKLTAGYNNEKAVLCSVSLDLPARAKVGFAGATGCGKSTTLLCLQRILEARSGRIVIGDLDISRLGLKLLRTMVGLVPQDATIFEGSWRYNVDPFGEFPDGRVWEALRCANLMHICSLPEGIDSKITAEGANMSFGQKQLLSLARMVIRQPPVLLLDECTSSLDPNTQKTVQDTVLNEFPLSTVIAIAHRVETLLDFDRIVVFDKGAVVEIGTVKEVLAIQNGIFAKMVSGVHS